MNERLLDKIDSPKDLKDLSFEDLNCLAGEIREELIQDVSKTGGHLAPNLGVVELTVALHYALESPKDRIIWDVGHQCYVHKMLTGRRQEMKHIRQKGGISGFPKRAESEHDVVDTGHSSTSLSFAIGLSEAMKKCGKEGKVAAVIGDGALTAGMAYEALNHGGHLKSDVMVILNDNEMSISPSVGSFSAYLSRVRLDSHYVSFEKEFEQRLKNIPAIGERMYEIGKHIKSSIKQLIVPGMLFEELGFKYIGPLDGHDIETVARNIQMAKDLDTPVLIHVVTRKGYGYKPAEDNPNKFHGTSAFDIKTGLAISKAAAPSYTEVFGDALVEIAEKDKKIIAITAAMTSGTGLDKFAERFPDRFYDVGIAEQHAVAFAAALALGGLKPVAAIYSTFLQRAYDQVIHDVCLQDMDVVFAIDRAGVVGEDGPTHHGVFDISYLSTIPNMVVMAPKDENELRHMLKTALEIKGPVAVRYPRRNGLGVKLEPAKVLETGRSEVLRDGQDVAIVALGTMVKTALDSADILAKHKISATVVNARFAKPLDEELLVALAQQHRLLVTVEENALWGGFGSNVLRMLMTNGVFCPALNLGLTDDFIPHGTIDELLDMQGLSSEKVAARIEQRLNKMSPTLASEAQGKLFKNLRKAFLSKINVFE
jgi:1-deoxy-D-xylulose-5-phosphate synthase